MTRRSFIIGILSLIAIIAVAAAFYDSVQVFRLSTRIDNLTATQIRNRAHNVDVWCGAINNLQNILVTFVAAAQQQHPGQVATLHLTSLDCTQLAQATVASAR